jgi:hypothetical protein
LISRIHNASFCCLRAFFPGMGGGKAKNWFSFGEVGLFCAHEGIAI